MNMHYQKTSVDTASVPPRILPASIDPSPWLPGHEYQQETLPLLFCFSYAGGTGELYRQWQRPLQQSCRVCPVELPGRGSRFGEPFARSIPEAAASIAAAIGPYSHARYALFGHSLGSVMALETARTLQRDNMPMPAAIVVSGRFPPHAQATRKRFHTVPDAALLDEMRRLGGTPEEILNNKEIIEMLLPVVRDDFRLLETFDSPQLPRVDAPIHVCCGRDDEDSPVALLERWEEVTSASCSITLFQGGHFYINESRDALLRHIEAVMRDVGGHRATNRSL